MAVAIILPLITSILPNIASFTGGYVTEEIKGFKSVKDDLKAVAGDLESIMSVLHDAESKQYTNDAMKKWLSDLKSVVYDIDDLLDEAATDAKQRSLNKGHILPKLGYYLSLKPLISRFDLTHKIKVLRLTLDNIVAQKKKFGLTDRPVEAPSVERDVFDACAYVNTLDIIGRDDAKTNLINRVRCLSDQSSLSVLPIVGMGGIGKTAIAKLVFNEIDQFEIKKWVCVSDKFDIPKILRDILGDTRENTNSSLDTLVRTLQDALSGKKFLLVLDDLWEENNEQWKKLKGILDVGGKGSVILITTRIEKVALITQSTTPYNLDKLPNSACWSLFKNLAFMEGEEERYPSLCEIGVSIVEKCCGVPLVVRCLGSLLRSERDEGEWLRVKDMENLNKLDGQYDRVKQLLKLSYDKLPSRLKSCFAYLSLFPKDYEYFSYFQHYYWSALGLSEGCDGNYFNRKFVNELLSRSMIQDPTLENNNIVSNFKIHDLLHDLAEDILGDELAVVTKNKLSALVSSRYVAWGLNFADQEFPKHVEAKKARAFIFQFENIEVSQSFVKGIILNMPCLRVLDFNGSQIEELPRSIGSLKHLRLLNLSDNRLIESLPDTLCQLLNLECLLLHHCDFLEEVPSEMYKLVSLKFLTLTTSQRSLVQSNLNRLPCLRQLWIISCNKLEYLWDSNDAGCLTSLEWLYISNCPNLKTLPNSMKLLVRLKELRIVGCEELDIESGGCMGGLRSLQTLHIKGLPRLSRLSNDLQFAASSLQYLWIVDCEGLVELPNWLESFTSLQKLGISDCPCLLSLPEGIRHLKSLQYLEIQGCPHISRRFASPDGEYLPLINHVHEIKIDGQSPSPSRSPKMRNPRWRRPPSDSTCA